MSTFHIDLICGICHCDGLTMVFSLMMLRRGYAYISLLFVAIWILVNISYVRKLSVHEDVHQLHMDHDHAYEHNDAINEIGKVSDFELKKDINVEKNPKEQISYDGMLDIKHGMERHSFNVSASNDVPLDREVPDFRHKMCPMVYDTSELPMVSIIICFHNEALSTLLRTLSSIVHNTPRELLLEIILMDDASTYDYLQHPLSTTLKKDYPKVKLIRSQKRLGIAKARIRGIMKARGTVLAFLDSHCECAKGWLEPLLKAIVDNPRQIVCPEVDIIDYKTFAYTKPDQSYEGSFDWELNMVLKPLSAAQKLSRTTPIDPIRTATMLGGIFAVHSAYFHSIGLFSNEMQIWGGENLELSFRIWICGGSISILPCSRVGHVFRPVIPYGFPEYGPKATLHKNNQHVAESWMDGFKKYYYGAIRKGRTFNPVLVHNYNRFLRSKLECKDFYWYLTNIVPDLPVPPDDAAYFGQLRQKNTCVEVDKMQNLFLSECEPQKATQTFHMTPAGRLMHINTCARPPQSDKITMSFCDENALICTFTGPSQLSCNQSDYENSMCLQSTSVGQPLMLQECETDIISSQIWSFTHHMDLELVNSEI